MAVCNFHRDQLSLPETRWRFDHDAVNGTRDLRVGFHQEELHEFVVLEPPMSALAYGRGHEVSHAADDGLYFPMTVQQRGKDEPETVTLVMTPERAAQFAEFLSMVTNHTGPPDTQSGQA